MNHQLPALPLAADALEPVISAETIDYHYGKHHQAYVTNLNNLVPGTEFENASLEEIVLQSDGGIFNNAAQVFNHTFYWNCLSRHGGGEPTGALAVAIVDAFGSFADFKEQFTAAAATQFGSGWAWLSLDKEGQLQVTSTANQDNPLSDGLQPILGLDVWEHAYYLNYQNRRPDYIEAWWNVVDWAAVEENLKRARG